MCDYKFTALYDLKLHVNDIPVGEDIFVCNFCSYSTKDRSLKGHIFRKHSKQKVFIAMKRGSLLKNDTT